MRCHLCFNPNSHSNVRTVARSQLFSTSSRIVNPFQLSCPCAVDVGVETQQLPRAGDEHFIQSSVNLKVSA